MVVFSANAYVADELANKVYHLTKALDQTKTILKTLEKENQDLKNALDNLASINKENYCCRYGELGEFICAS